MSNILIDMDNALSDAEITLDKVAVICRDVKEDYFSEREPKDWFLKVCYNQSGVKMEILLDYLYLIERIYKNIARIT